MRTPSTPVVALPGKRAWSNPRLSRLAVADAANTLDPGVSDGQLSSGVGS